MGKSLIIVESPTKKKTIKRYLGDGYDVESSVGHIKDLPPKRLGIDIENGFKPEYQIIPGKKKIVQQLKQAAKKADSVFLALDPDREGEAIAWHVAEELKKSRYKGPIYRILFHEITKRAIQEALSHPGELNRALYEAQQARRLIDRLVGYELSPLLWKKIRRGLSAGRVQSVAVRLIVEREREIQNFKPEEYWTIEALLQPEAPDSPEFKAKLVKWKGKKPQLKNKEQAEAVVKLLEKAQFTVEKIQKKERKRRPSAPYITSRLQQDAANYLKFSPKKTMQIAQQLYEGIELGEEGPAGLITYMRTDSTRVSPEAVKAVREWIRENFGKEYVPPKPPTYGKKKTAQDAHEAIRPTDVTRTPEKVKPYLTRDQYQLYKMIWTRFVASQMAPAKYYRTTVDIAASEGILRAIGEILLFDGFTKLSQKSSTPIPAAEDSEKSEKDQKDKEVEVVKLLPPLEEGQPLNCKKCEAQQHFTQPPKRFKEGSLVRELEERGIGRPSTYASILSVIQEKEYVEKKNGHFYPTELGFIVTDLLVQHFPTILDVKFTARMEERLDNIEEGKENWKSLLKEFYASFKEMLEKAQKEMKNLKLEGKKTDIKCDKCGAEMVIKLGKRGEFLGCSNYPQCKNTKDFIRDEKGQIQIRETTAEKVGTCPNCGADMVVKSGKYGRFFACSNYPQCKTTQPYSTGVKCPECGEGELLEKRGKKGGVFYSCSNYPQCQFAMWNPPLPEPCPHCQFPITEKVEKSGKGRQPGIYCPKCKKKIEPQNS